MGASSSWVPLNRTLACTPATQSSKSTAEHTTGLWQFINYSCTLAQEWQAALLLAMRWEIPQTLFTDQVWCQTKAMRTLCTLRIKATLAGWLAWRWPWPCCHCFVSHLWGSYFGSGVKDIWDVSSLCSAPVKARGKGSQLNTCTSRTELQR